jgi:uncharacterized membrane protein
MATVDVEVETVINRPRSVVAAYCCDPDNATAWYANIKAVEWKTPKPLAQGSRFAFTAQFLGRTLNYIYEVIYWAPEQRFVMCTATGPFPMETTYSWEDRPDGSTRMKLRNRGVPSGFSVLMKPFMAAAMKRATTKDLARLKAILEAAG